MNNNTKSIIVGLAIGLLSGAGHADEPKEPESEVEILRKRVAALESRLTQMQHILRAKDVLPPEDFDRLEVWTPVRIKIDPEGVIHMDGQVHDVQSVSDTFVKIYKSGKFPDLKVAKHPKTPEDAWIKIYLAIQAAGAPTVSFESWAE